MAANSTWIRPGTLTCPEIVRTIRLEPLEARHAGDLLEAADRELFRHSMQAPAEWSVHGFEREMERVMALPDVVAYAIVLTGDDGDLRVSGCFGGRVEGQAIGRTTFMDIKPEHRGVEIGRTWIGRRWHGTEVNPAAKYLMLRHAFETLTPPAVRVQLTTSGTNLHSQAAIAKLGAVRGVLRKARIMPAGLDRPEPLLRDWVVYSIVEEEWPGVKARLEQRLKRGGAL